jgi:hypothetical protein
MKKNIILKIFIPLILVSIYFTVIFFSPLPYAVIDQDKSGVISLLELLDSNDIGKRQQNNGVAGCIEYYWFKDGLVAYQTCKN